MRFLHSSRSFGVKGGLQGGRGEGLVATYSSSSGLLGNFQVAVSRDFVMRLSDEALNLPLRSLLQKDKL